VLGAVKVWPGKRRALGKVGATANLDSSCARRLCNTAGRDEETGFQSNKETRSRKQERKITALKPLDNKSPIQGFGEAGDRAGVFGDESLLRGAETGTLSRLSGQSPGKLKAFPPASGNGWQDSNRHTSDYGRSSRGAQCDCAFGSTIIRSA
jgi:hypothetical protein